MKSISLFYCCEGLFSHVNTCMIDKNSMKHHYLKKKLQSPRHGTYRWWGLRAWGWGLWGFWGVIWESIMICVFMAVYYCWMVWMGVFGVFDLGYMNSALLIFSLRRSWRGGRGWGGAACIWWSWYVTGGPCPKARAILPRFILLVSFSNTLLVVSFLDMVYDCYL